MRDIITKYWTLCWQGWFFSPHVIRFLLASFVSYERSALVCFFVLLYLISPLPTSGCFKIFYLFWIFKKLTVISWTAIELMNTETGPAYSDCRLNLWKHFLVYFSLLHSFPAKKALKTLKRIEIRCPEQGGRKIKPWEKVN